MATADPQQARSRQLSTSGTSLYELLGLDKSATQEQIKKSYRKKALTCHPDKNRGDEAATELFKQINHANSVLTDPTKKKIYDQYGSMGLHLASQIGEERFGTYLLLQKPWAKVLCGVLVLLTGCCCCCCCCFCCNCCCGKCGPQPEYDEESPNLDDSGSDEPVDAPVTNEPISMGPPPPAATAAAATSPDANSFHDDREVLITVDSNTPIALGPPPGQPTSYGTAE